MVTTVGAGHGARKAAFIVLLIAATGCGGGESGSGDSSPPSAPSSLSASALSASSAQLSWSPSSDDVGVSFYRVYRWGAALSDVGGLSHVDVGLSASTNYCWTVTAFDGAGNESGHSNQACATTLAGGGTNYTLTVTKGGTGSGTVTGTGISCGVDCTEVFASGTAVTLTAAASAGSTFAGWTGCTSSSGTTCNVTMSANRTVTATFNLAQVCTPSATRCTTGNIEVQERCNASGTAWVQEACGTWRLCAKDTCRVACGMSSAPTNPTVCLVPIGDGVNNGEWTYWTDGRLASGTYVHARSQTNAGGYAPIYSEAAEVWPYSWSIGSMDLVGVEFRLDQFGYTKTPRLGFRARRAGIVTGYVNHFLTGAFSPTLTIGNCSELATFSWTNTSCFVPSPLNQSFNYTGGFNSMLLSITGDGLGGAIDVMDVNWVYLSIEP